MAANTTLREQLASAKKETAEKGSVSSTLNHLDVSANAVQVELQQELDNLRRENKLITSAWYDMTMRLQSNTVVLQRRSEQPKSWLGKQRLAVGGSSSLVRLTVRPAPSRPGAGNVPVFAVRCKDAF